MIESSGQIVRLSLVQMACGESSAENLRTALSRIADAARQGAQIICLQELFSTAYPCQTEQYDRFSQAEAIPGPTCNALAAAAHRHEVVIVGSIFERRAAGLYHNTAAVFDVNGQLVGKYRKMHIPDDPHYYEKFYFAPGDLGFPSFATRFGHVAVGVCWDQWFPEAARLMALTGAELLLYPTAIGWLPDEREAFGESQTAAWETMLRSHAIANGTFVAATNRVGQESGLQFWGGSCVVDPYGNVVARAACDADETLVVDCNLAEIEAARTHWPFLRDRRPDAYAGLTRQLLDQPPGNSER